MSGQFFRGGPGADPFNGGPGNDTFLGGGGADQLFGAGGNDDFIFVTAAQFTAPGRVVSGGDGFDRLLLRRGMTLDDAAFTGVGGVEFLRLFGTDAFSLTFGAQAALAFGPSLVVRMDPAAADLFLDASALPAGTALNLRRTGGNDTILGGAGDDRINVGGGADVVSGGAGNDTFVFNSQADFLAPGRSVAGDAGNDRLIFYSPVQLADADFAGVSGMEAIRLAGPGLAILTLGAQASQAFASGLDVVLTADVSQLILFGGGLATGTALRVTGTASVDTIEGGAGDDTITGGGGGDLILGGAGDDTLIFTRQGFGAAGLSIDGGDGFDTLVFTNSVFLDDIAFALPLNMEALRFLGRGESEITLGGFAELNFGPVITVTMGAERSLRLDGGQLSAATALDARGQGGEDRFFGGAADDLLIGGGGDDLLSGGLGVDTLRGGVGDDLLGTTLGPVGAARDLVRGDAGRDALWIDMTEAQLADAVVQAELLRLKGVLDGVAPGAEGPRFRSDALQLDLQGVEGASVRVDGQLLNLAEATAPVFRIRLVDNTLPEGTAGSVGMATFHIERVGGSLAASTITYTIGAGLGVSASAGDLFNGFGTFTTTIAQGQSFAGLTVVFTDDGNPEPDESFAVTLDSASVGRIQPGGASAEAVIRDDDSIADLSLTLTRLGGSGDVTLGDRITYQVRVTNDGPGTTGGEVSLLASSGITLNSVGGPGQNPPLFDFGTGRWSFEPLAAGQSSVITVEYLVASSGLGQNDIQAEVVAADLGDPDSTPDNGAALGEDDGARDVFTVRAPEADLSLTLTRLGGSGAVTVGDRITYEVRVTNDGPGTTGGAVSILQSNGITIDSFGGAPGETPVFDAGTGLWSFAPLASGQSTVITIEYLLSAPGLGQNDVVAEVVAADLGDPDSTPDNGAALGEDDGARDVFTVRAPEADLSLTLTRLGGSGAVTVGERITYQVSVTNDGPDTTGGAVSILPSAGMTVTSVSGAGPNPPVFDAGTGLWSFAPLASGQSTVITIEYLLSNPGLGQNDVVAEVVAADLGDPDSTPANGAALGEDDGARDLFTVRAPQADLSVTGPTALVTGTQGGIGTVTFTVTNSGPEAGGGTFGLASILPLAGAAPVVSAGSVDSAGIWTLPELASGGIATITYTLSLNQSGAFTVVGEILSATRPDPDSVPGNFDTEPTPEDDAAIANLSVAPSADLSLSASVTDTTVLFGEEREILFTVRNAGTIAGGGTVRITDGTGWTGLVWNTPVIQPGDQAVLNFGYVFGDLGPRTITAEIETATQPDPDSTPGNFATAPFEDDGVAINFTMPTSWRVTRLRDAPEGSDPTLDIATNVFRIERFGTDLPQATINWSYSPGSGPNPVSADDIVALNLPIPTVFQEGQTALLIAVTTKGDSTPEPDETVRLRLDSVSAGVIAPGFAEAETRITDDDTPAGPVFSMQAASGLGATITEDFSAQFPLGVRFTRTGDLSQAATVTYRVGPGVTGDSATADDLAAGFGSFTAFFAAGQSEIVALIFTSDDTTPEPFETFTVELTGTTVGTLGGNLLNEYTIANDDLGPPPQLGPAFYFSGFNADRGRELWVYDTNAQNGDPRANVAAEWVSGPASSDPRDITVLGETLFFRVDDLGTQRWLALANGVAFELDLADDLGAFDPSLPLAEQKLAVVADGHVWLAAAGGFMNAYDGDGTPAFSVALEGFDRSDLTALSDGFAYSAFTFFSADAQLFAALARPDGTGYDSVQVTSGGGGNEFREIAAFTATTVTQPELVASTSLFFAGTYFDPFLGSVDALWRVRLEAGPNTGGSWGAVTDAEFLDVNGTGTDPSDPGFILLNPTDLTLSVTGAGERLFFFGSSLDTNGNVSEALFALAEGASGTLSWQSTRDAFGAPVFQGLEIRPYEGGVVFSGLAETGIPGAPTPFVATWTDADGDGSFSLDTLFQNNFGTVEHLTVDAEGRVAFVVDSGNLDELYIHLPTGGTNGTPINRQIVQRFGEIDELQLSGGTLVYRTQSDAANFPTLFVHDIAANAGGEIGSDEPLLSPGTLAGAIGANTVVSTAFGLVFQAFTGAPFPAPFLFTTVEGSAPDTPGNVNVNTRLGFGWGSGTAFDDAWIGTGFRGDTAELGLFRVDEAGATTLYTESANFTPHVAAGLGREVLFGTSSAAVNRVLLHDLDTGMTATLEVDALLGGADRVGSRLVWTSRDETRVENMDTDPDNDVWGIYSLRDVPGGREQALLAEAPRKDNAGEEGPLRALNPDGTTFLGDDTRVFWLQRNDANGANGAGSEIHAVDLTAQNPALTLRVFDLAPGATSGAGEFGEAVYANGRLYFVGSADGTVGGRALWTVGPDFTLTKVTGTDLRDPFGLVERPIVVNGEVFFTAREDAGGFERLFQVNDDGVTATELALPGAPNFIATAHDIGNDIALVAVDASGPFTLGPVQVFRFTPGSQPGLEGAVTQLTSFAEDSDAITDVTLGGDGEIYFVRSIPATGTELWVVDGTVPEGARLLADINADPVPVGYAPEQVVAAPFLI